MSVTPMAARFGAVTDDSGARITERRKTVGLEVPELAEKAGLDKGVVYRAERGERVRDSSLWAIEKALAAEEHEFGLDVPSVVAQPVGDADDGLVEFTVEGHFGVRAIVKGPVRNIDALKSAVADLIAGMDRSHPEG